MRCLMRRYLYNIPLLKPTSGMLYYNTHIHTHSVIATISDTHCKAILNVWDINNSSSLPCARNFWCDLQWVYLFYLCFAHKLCKDVISSFCGLMLANFIHIWSHAYFTHQNRFISKKDNNKNTNLSFTHSFHYVPLVVCIYFNVCVIVCVLRVLECVCMYWTPSGALLVGTLPAILMIR